MNRKPRGAAAFSPSDCRHLHECAAPRFNPRQFQTGGRARMACMERGSDGSGTWPVWKQMARADIEGLAQTAASPRTEALTARTAEADRVVSSVCPYCGV